MRSVVYVGCALSFVLASTMAVAQEDPSPERLAAAAEPADGESSEGASGDERVAQSSGSSQDLGDYVETQLMEPQRSFPYLEHHGYFRFRGDMFWNLDLDTRGTSPVLPPLEATPVGVDSDPDNRTDVFDSGSELLGSANIRFKYHPIFHISEGARIHLELDILDNLVLGSTPDGFSIQGNGINPRFDVPLGAFAPGAQPMAENLTFREAIRVREAYAEMEFLGLIRVGRMASNWGLGILANRGGSYSSTPLVDRSSMDRNVSLGGFDCVDCDFGDVVDRFLFVTRVLDTLYVGFLFDWQNQGTASYRANRPYDQPRDLAEVDDVFEVVFTVFRSYFTEREQRERARILTELNRPIIEGGVYFVIRSQSAEQGSGGFLPNDTESLFYPRLGDAWIPDLWVRLQWEPAFRQRIRLELEAVALFGQVENVFAGLPDADFPELAKRDIQQFGLAFESDFRWDKLVTGLNAGFASGRSTTGNNAVNAPGWGVLDLNPVTGGSQSDRDVTNFAFDRAYFIDMVMFREVIGAITNAIYFDPYFQYDFFTAQSSSMGARLDLVFAWAAKPEVTPGGGSFIGFEPDITLYYQTDTYRINAAYGLFVPGSAFDGVAGRARIPWVADFWDLDPAYTENVNATLAHTLQFMMAWAF